MREECSLDVPSETSLEDREWQWQHLQLQLELHPIYSLTLSLRLETSASSSKPSLSCLSRLQHTAIWVEAHQQMKWIGFISVWWGPTEMICYEKTHLLSLSQPSRLFREHTASPNSPLTWNIFRHNRIPIIWFCLIQDVTSRNSWPDYKEDIVEYLPSINIT